MRKSRSLTLADLAERCDPPTTPQTIGRLETGTRTLSIDWLQRIADALEVEPDALIGRDQDEPAMVVARLTDAGAEPLTSPREAVPPDALIAQGGLSVIEVQSGCGDYRGGDRIWLKALEDGDTARAINRDVLVPRTGGRFAFGRLIDRDSGMVALLPPGAGQRQIVVRDPPWVAVAVLLVRLL